MVYTATSFQSNRQLQKTIFAQLSDPPLSTPSRYGIRSKPYQWGDDIVYYELLQEQGLYYLRVPEPMEGKQAVFTRYYLLNHGGQYVQPVLVFSPYRPCRSEG
ncbi:hypothetical protein BWI93_04745 [Siphonobacter sp. BAB-5385]|nr:hypothetical protein BWI93_04745 [Siphonobacter sp. BAB-5385]